MQGPMMQLIIDTSSVSAQHFRTFQDGNLAKAGPCLFELSEFLLGQAVELGTEFLASRFLTYH